MKQPTYKMERITLADCKPHADAEASLALSIVAFAVVITKPFELSKRLDRLERKFARTVGWVEGLTGQTLGRKDEEVA